MSWSDEDYKRAENCAWECWTSHKSENDRAAFNDALQHFAGMLSLSYRPIPMTDKTMDELIERLRREPLVNPTICPHVSALLREAADALEAAGKQRERDEEHYQAAMAMNEKHRKLWCEAAAEIASLRSALDTLWGALSWIDTSDPETTAHAENKFGFDLQNRVIHPATSKK